MQIEGLEKQIRDNFSKLFMENKQVEKVFKRMRTGVATYEDAQLYALNIGEILRDTFLELDIKDANIDEISNIVLSNAMTQNYNLVSMVCSVVQENLNDAAGVNLNPIQPDLNMSKVEGLKTVLSEGENIEKAQIEVADALDTFTNSVVDDWIKVNATFQAKAGLKPIIIRDYEGMHIDPHRKPIMQDCKFCKALQGTFDYADAPKDIYKRHKKCKCTVTYYPNKDAKGRITALEKGQKDTEQVLWNTGKEFSNSRRAVLRRRKERYGLEEAKRILNAEWKNGFNGNPPRHFN